MTRALIVATALGSLLLTQSAAAIVIRDDVPDSAYRAAPTEYPQLARVMGTSEGNLVAPQWVLTAAHVVEGVDPFSHWRVDIGGRTIEVEKIVLHPKRTPGEVNSDTDLALLKLVEPVAGISPIPLYRWDDEGLKTFTTYGRGGTRTGKPGGEMTRDDVLRKAANRFDAAFEHSLVSTFSPPGEALDLEGAGGPRDSGGPALIEREGVRYLAGIGSFGSPPGEEAGVYGTVEGYARISGNREWIESTIAADPPSTLPRWSPETVVKQRVAWPATSAGALADAFFAAYGNEARLQKFMRDHGTLASTRTPADRAKGWMDQREEWGDLAIYSYRQLGERDIAVMAYADKSKSWHGFWFTADAAHPDHLDGMLSGGLPAPSETARAVGRTGR